MVLYLIHQNSVHILLKNNACYLYELINSYNNPVDPSRTTGLDQCFIPVKWIWGNRHVEFINTEFSIWKTKTLLKPIKKKNSVGMNKQERHLLLSSTGQEDFKNGGGGGVSEFPRKGSMSFYFF